MCIISQQLRISRKLPAMISAPTCPFGDLYLEQINLLISKYDSMLNYIKQYNLIVSVCIRDPKNNTKNMLTSLVIAFDRCVQEYCYYYINLRIKHPIYFMIDPLSFQQNQAYINSRFYKKLGNEDENDKIIDFEKSNIQWKSYENGYFLMKQLFVRDDDDAYNVKYRMHMQIWKKNGVTLQTNQILTKYEEYFMIELLNRLYLQGFITHFSSDLAAHLCNKKPKLSYFLAPYCKHQKTKQNYENSSQLFQFIEFQCKKYLDFMTDVSKCRLACAGCSKTLMYSHTKNLMMPPFIKIQPSIDKIQRTQTRQYKVLHESCCPRYLINSKIKRPPNYDIQLQMQQKQRQMKQKNQQKNAL